ncbi:hypothetical protein A5650_22285 [Mycobacterium sp. 1164985.4]|nr:hypothetical protein A5650_22285 [Mycobacterium sp. 1164985.4]
MFGVIFRKFYIGAVRLHCQHSKVGSPTGMFVTALHLAHWTACIPLGVDGVPGVATAATMMPITPKKKPKTA